MRALLFLFLTTALAAQTIQKSNTTENLRGISVLANGIAWASGTHGSYLRTTDGGNSWQPAQVPGADALDFRDVEAFSADLAYLLSAGPAEQSRIYKTTDAGKTWALQFTNKNPNGFFDCMAFWDSDHGIAVGDPVADNSGTLRFELISTDRWRQDLDSASTRLHPAGDRRRGRICRQRNLHHHPRLSQRLVCHRRKSRARFPFNQRRQNLGRRPNPNHPRPGLHRHFLHRLPRPDPRSHRRRRLQTSRPGRPQPRLHQRRRPHLDSFPNFTAKVLFRRSFCQAALGQRSHRNCGIVRIRLRR